jgi:hypothetical protein
MRVVLLAVVYHLSSHVHKHSKGNKVSRDNVGDSRKEGRLSCQTSVWQVYSNSEPVDVSELVVWLHHVNEATTSEWHGFADTFAMGIQARLCKFSDYLQQTTVLQLQHHLQQIKQTVSCSSQIFTHYHFIPSALLMLLVQKLLLATLEPSLTTTTSTTLLTTASTLLGSLLCYYSLF